MLRTDVFKGRVVQADRQDSDFTDVLETPEEIIEEPSFLSYTARFWEAPDGELYFRPWREFLMLPGRQGLYRVAAPEDARMIFNILKLRNILAFTLLFMLIAGCLALLSVDGIAIASLWPDAVLALFSLVGAFAVGLVPINLWCLWLFVRQVRRRRDARAAAGTAVRGFTAAGGR